MAFLQEQVAALLSLPPTLLLALLTALIFLPPLIYTLLPPASPPRTTTLLLGASSAGKTTLFHALLHASPPPRGTLPSQTPSSAASVTDFPGHARLRPLLPPHLASARVVIFVVDARALAPAARFLHEVLSDAAFARSAVPLLVFCNKTDENGLAAAKVRERLEAEVERVRKSAGAGLAALAGGGEDEKKVFLGYEDEVFRFDHVDNAVAFGTGSALKGEVNDVVQFIGDMK